MALTFFWRCESAGAMDSTDDENANNATETPGTTGSPSISGTAAKVGSNGVLIGAGAGTYTFNVDTDIITASEGAMACWVNVQNWPGSAPFFKIRGSTFSNNVSIATDDANDLKFYMNEDGTPHSWPTTISTLATSNWYFVGIAWDDAANSRRIVVLNDISGTPLFDGADTTTNFTAPGELARDPGIQIGDCSGLGWQGYIDNVFIGNAYEDLDDFVTYRNISTATAYGMAGGRTTKNTRSAPLGMELGMGWRM